MKRLFFPSLFSFSTNRNKKTVPRREQQAQRRQKKKGSAMSSLRQTAMRLLVFVFLLAYFSFPTAVTAEGADAKQRENPVRLTVLQTTDLHGAAGAAGRDDIPGIARIVSIVESERKRDQELLLIDCGDTALGSFSSTLDGGDSMFRVMNLARYDAWIPGNHDFDRGIPLLLKHAGMLEARPLAANLEIQKEEGNAVFEDWILLERKGLRIAVIGMVPEHLSQWIAPAQLEGSSRHGILETLDRILPRIMRASPDLILLAVHAGEFTQGRLYKDGKRRSLSEITARYPQIHLLLGGHSHQCVPGKKLYPDSWFVQGPPFAEGAARTVIEYDRKQRRILSMQTDILFSRDYPDSPETMDLLTPLLRETEIAARKTVARFDCGEGGSSALRGNLSASAVTRLFCRAMTEETHAAAAFLSIPEKRSLPPSSPPFSPGTTAAGGSTVLTERQLFDWMPYENFITILHLNSAEAEAIINEQERLENRKSAMIAYGLEYRLNAERRSVEGPLLLSPGTQSREKGELWESGRIRLPFAFSGYAASGAGGRYPVLRCIAASEAVQRRDLPLTIRDAVRRFLMKNYPPSSAGGLK